MSSKYAGGESRLEPLGETGSRFYLAAGIFALLSAVGIAIFLLEVSGAHLAHLGNWGTQGAVPLGIDIGAFTLWSGIGIGALVVSATIRLLRIDGYLGIARIGEFLALPAFLGAFMHVLYDLGRPGRVYNSIIHPQVGSPLFWDIVLLGGLGIIGLVYLVLAGRDEGSEGTVRKLAALILLYVPIVAGGFVPWILGTTGSGVVWFGAIQGPIFMLLSFAAGLATLLVATAGLRLVAGWDQFSDRKLGVLGAATAATGTLYLVGTGFTLQSGVFASIGGSSDIAIRLANSGYGTATIVLMLLGILVAVLLASQVAFDWSSTPVTLAGGILLVVVILGLETVSVAGGLSFPELMYPEGSYVPSIAELLRSIGTVGIVGLGMMVLAKVLPIAPAETSE